MDTEKSVTHKLRELKVVNLALEYFLPKCITAMFLENGQGGQLVEWHLLIGRIMTAAKANQCLLSI